ncbi:MAG: DUF6882 domain-containing protein [Microbacterium sp.]
MSLDVLRPLADRAALFTALRQDQLRAAADSLGEHRWDADLTARTLTFSSISDPNRRIVATAHLVASIAPGPRSVLWGWAHPMGAPDGVSAGIRAYGAQYGLSALTEPELPLGEAVAGEPEAWVAEVAHVIGGVAGELTGRAPYYSAPTGGGARAVFVLDGVLGPLTVADALIVLPRILQTTPMTDPRTSVWDLARLAAWQLQWTDEAFRGAAVSDATGSATFQFDEQARITGIQSTLGG